VYKSDFLIIGGGVIGLSIARELHKRGMRKITILECGKAGREASWAAAGMLSPDIESSPDGHFYRLCRRSLSIYRQFADDLFDESGVDIELDRSGTLALDLDHSEEFESTFDEQHDAGVNVHFLNGDAIHDLEPNVSEHVKRGLLYPDNWQVENRRLLTALQVNCERESIIIHENSRVDQLVANNGHIVGAETKQGRLFAEHVVVATGAWTSLIKIGERSLPFQIEPILGQMICFSPAVRLINCVAHGPRGYLVPRQDGRILAGSTSEERGFEKGVTDEAVKKLRSMAAELVPALSNEAVVDSWSGLRPCSADKLPVIGQIPGVSNLTVATAHYRNGILLAPVTASIVADGITGIGEFPAAFTPDRFFRDSTVANA
jgi:glycine oxidase